MTGLAVFLAGCAALPDRLYSEETTPVALTGIAEAGLLDLRAEYRAAACRRFPAEAPPCEDIVLRLSGEAASAALAPRENLAAQYRIGLVPGLFAECFDSYAQTFGDVQQAMQADGFHTTYFQVPGRGSSAENADLLAARIAELPPDPRPFIVFAHSKGLIDILEMVVRHPAAAESIVAVVGVAGAANGSPLADNLGAFYRSNVAGFPFADCKSGDGREVEDLGKQRRLAWWDRHRRDITIPLFSLVAAPQPDSISPLVRFSYDRLAKSEPRNDGKLIWYDQIAPQSHLLGYVNADHWTIAVPAYQEVGALRQLFEDRVPRTALIHAAVEVVAAALSSGS